MSENKYDYKLLSVETGGTVDCSEKNRCETDCEKFLERVAIMEESYVQNPETEARADVCAGCEEEVK